MKRILFACMVALLIAPISTLATVTVNGVEITESSSTGSLNADNLLSGTIPAGRYADCTNIWYAALCGDDANSGLTALSPVLLPQTAIDAASAVEAAGGGHQIVMFGGGDFAGGLVLKKGVSLCGAGRRATRLTGSLTVATNYTGGVVCNMGILATTTTGAKFTSLITDDTKKLRLQNVGFAFKSLTGFTATPIVLSGGHVIFDNVGVRVTDANFNSMGTASGSLLTATNGCKFEANGFRLYLEDMINTNVGITMFDLKNTGGVSLQGGSMNISISGACHAEVKGIAITGANGERNISDFHIHIEGDDEDYGDADGAYITAGTNRFNDVQMHVSGFADNHSYHGDGAGVKVAVHNADDSTSDNALMENGAVLTYEGSSQDGIHQADGYYLDGVLITKWPESPTLTGHNGTNFISACRSANAELGLDPLYNNMTSWDDGDSRFLQDTDGYLMDMNITVSGFSGARNDGMDEEGSLFTENAIESFFRTGADGTGTVTITGEEVGETYVYGFIFSTDNSGRGCTDMNVWIDGSYPTVTVVTVANTNDVIWLTNSVSTGTTVFKMTSPNAGERAIFNAMTLRGPAGAGLDGRYLRLDGTFPMAGDADIGGNDIDDVGTGSFTNVIAEQLSVRDTTLDTNTSFTGVDQSHTKTAGATDGSDIFVGISSVMRYNDVGSSLGSLRGINAQGRFDAGTMAGPSAAFFGGQFSAQLNGGVVTNFAYGGRFDADLNSGDVQGNAYGGYFRVDAESAMTSVGNIYGGYFWVDDDKGSVGNTYMLYLSENSGVDYGIYQNGTASNYLGGPLAVAALSLNGSTLPTSASTGDIMRYDGTNWLATSAYVDRGDIAVFDYTNDAFIADNTWRNISFRTNSIGDTVAPVGVEAVDLFVYLKDDTVGCKMEFRKNGNTNSINIGRADVHASDIAVYDEFVVSVDSDGLAEYRLPVSATNATRVRVVVRGLYY